MKKNYLFEAHLHTHFDTSKMDATCKIKETVKVAKEMGFSAISINDHGNINGHVEFAMACDSNNIKPIFGVEGYEAVSAATDKNYTKGQRIYYHSNFMAKNKKGKDFLNRLVTFGYKKDNFYNKPRFDIDFLKKEKDEIKGNVIWCSACVGGRLPQYLLEGKDTEAQEYFDTMVDIFGIDNVYVEIQNHGEEEESKARELLIKFARQNNAKLLATNDVHYLKKEDYISREILLARNSGETIRERKEKGKIYPSELYLKSKEEMDRLFQDVPDALTNTKVLVDSVEWIDFKGTYWHYPKTDTPEGYTVDSYLRKMTYDMLEKKYPVNTMSEDLRNQIYERIDTELEVMAQMDASAYMLIDADFTQAAKRMGIPTGKGRGSACGSIVADIIDITDINPMKYDLYFERKRMSYCAL